MTSYLSDMTSSPIFFWRCCISLVNFSYWSKFHVNIIPVFFRVMIIFFYKGLTRNPEIRNTPVCVLPNIWRLRELGIPNLVLLFLIKCYWMLQKARVIHFNVSELLRENQSYTTPPRLRLTQKCYFQLWHSL